MCADQVCEALVESQEREKALLTLLDASFMPPHPETGVPIALAEWDRLVRADERAQIIGGAVSGDGDGGDRARIAVDAVLAAVDDALTPFRVLEEHPQEPGGEIYDSTTGMGASKCALPDCELHFERPGQVACHRPDCAGAH